MNSSNCSTESVAEHALALYMATRRSLVAVHNALLHPYPPPTTTRRPSYTDDDDDGGGGGGGRRTPPPPGA